MAAPALNVAIQGMSQESADNLNTFLQVTNLVSDLNNFVGTVGVTVLCLGYAAINDGSGGFYYWNALATQPGNGTTLIIPNGSALGGWSKVIGV